MGSLAVPVPAAPQALLRSNDLPLTDDAWDYKRYVGSCIRTSPRLGS